MSEVTPTPTADVAPATPAAPAARTRRGRLPVVLALAAAAAVLAVAAYMAVPRLGGPAGGGFTFQAATTDDLTVTVRKDGELQAIRSTDIVSRVEGQVTLVEIVPEGTQVEAGDVIGKLDSSNIERELEETELEYQAAEADLKNAEEQLIIEQAQVEADNQAAEVELTLAELDVKQYEEGTYPQAKADAEVAVEMARINLENAEEELLQTRTLFGKDFVTSNEVKKRELEVLRLRNALDKAETDYEVLTKYTHPRDLAGKRNQLAQKEKALARTQRRGQSSLNQRIADVNNRRLRLLNRQERLDWCREQLEYCTLRAPKSGLVVYGAAGNQREQDQVVEGATIRERQTVVRLPDTSTMKAVVKINESRVGMLEPGQPAVLRTTAGSRTIGGEVSEISVVADSNRRWFNPDVREYPVDILLDETPANLKPGMKVQATIMVDTAQDATVVPLTSLYSVGRRRFVFVPQGGTDAKAQVEPREVSVGLMNETHAQVTEGIEPGQAVVLLEVGQGRDLLERAGIDVEPQRQRRDPRGRPGDADDNGDDNGHDDRDGNGDDDRGGNGGDDADVAATTGGDTSAATDAGTVPAEPTPAEPTPAEPPAKPAA